jgi:hypothetical protein
LTKYKYNILLHPKIFFQKRDKNIIVEQPNYIIFRKAVVRSASNSSSIHKVSHAKPPLSFLMLLDGEFLHLHRLLQSEYQQMGTPR